MSRERGRAKLMLRLPHIRHLLTAEATGPLGEMFEGYDLAVVTLDRFRKESPGNHELIIEYEQLCREMELEVLTYCTRR